MDTGRQPRTDALSLFVRVCNEHVHFRGFCRMLQKFRVIMAVSNIANQTISEYSHLPREAKKTIVTKMIRLIMENYRREVHNLFGHFSSREVALSLATRALMDLEENQQEEFSSNVASTISILMACVRRSGEMHRDQETVQAYLERYEQVRHEYSLTRVPANHPASRLNDT